MKPRWECSILIGQLLLASNFFPLHRTCPGIPLLAPTADLLISKKGLAISHHVPRLRKHVCPSWTGESGVLYVLSFRSCSPTLGLFEGTLSHRLAGLHIRPCLLRTSTLSSHLKSCSVLIVSIGDLFKKASYCIKPQHHLERAR